MSSSPDSAKSEPFPSPIYAWFVVSLLILAAFIGYIDRQIPAIVSGPMQEDLGVSDTEISSLYGIFALFYAIAGIPIAWLADRKSRKYILAIGIFFWSAMTMVSGLTRNFAIITLARIGVGVGEATLTPVQNSLVGDYFPREKIALALSVLQAGPIIGSGIGFIIGGYVFDLAERLPPVVMPGMGELKPWQLTFFYMGIPGFLIAIMFLLIREPVRRQTLGAVKTAKDKPEAGVLSGFYRQYWKTLIPHHLGFLCFALLGYAFVFWTIPLFTRVHGLDAADASITFGWIFVFAGPLGPIIVAYVAKWLAQKGRHDANIVVPMLGALIGVFVVAAIPLMPSPTWAFILYAPALIFVNSPFAMAYASLTVIAPASIRARVAAVYMLVSSFGMFLGPPIAGAFNDVVFPGTDGVRWSLITVTAIFGFLGLVSLMFARRPYAEAAAAAERDDALSKD